MKILKEVLKISIGVVCVCLLCVSLAMAFTCDSSGCTINSLDFKCSKNVQIRCTSNGDQYAALSDHLRGERVFGLSSDSMVIYYKKKSVDQHYNSNPSASDSSAFSNWSSL